MDLTLVVLAFLGGLIIGSFLNVCIFRLPRDLSVWRPARSFCPGCETTIAWYDNIPLLSFVLLRGKSRCCRQQIPWRYPFVELLTGTLFAFCMWEFGPTPFGYKQMLFSAIMIDLIVTDWEERILPDEFTLGGTVIGFVLAWFLPMQPGVVFAVFSMTGVEQDPRIVSVIEAALGAGVASGLIFGLAFLLGRLRNKELMGFGDFKMLLLIGSFWGLAYAVAAIMISSLSGAVIGPVYAIIAKRRLISRLVPKAGRGGAAWAVVTRYPLPFGSFLGIAALVVALWWRP